MLKKVFIINIFICVIFFGWAFASTQDCESIISMDMLSPDGLNKLESYLSGDNVIAFLKAREKLLTYPYEELKEIRNKIESLDSAKRLKELIDGFITKMEDENIINEVENIFINNIPQSLNAPFYGDFIPDSNIRELSPQAERVYENNLSLKYNKNDLLKKNDTLWVNPKYAGKKSLSIPVQDKSGLDLKVLDNNDKAIRRWQYSLKDDNLRDFFFKSTDLRQWIKKYEESLIFPVTFKNTVILRNEYRIFCLDLKTSNEIWSLGNFDGSGYEFYNTFRHLHENSAGYELLLSDDMLFTELDHKLIALRLDNILEPKIAWQKNLGEFTLGAKPILNKKFLILTLINARSEIFICGFSALDGKLKWTTYIGTSSFLSPACSISCVNGNEVILGTNYGAIISIDSDNGSIIWIRKYSPKQYNIFEYWNKSCLKPYTNNKCPIKYDTEFIQVAGQTLCYKPRESDFFYMIDSKSGELKKQVLVDPEKFYILRVSRNKAVFLEKTNKITKNAVLKVVELSTGKNIYEFEIKGGYLSGVSYLSEEVTLFKCGEFIYLLKAAKDSIECKEIGGHLGGWLVNATRNNFFIADENNLFNYEFKAYQTADTGDLKYTEEQEGILLKTLKEAISLNTGDNKETRLKSSILNLLKQKNISLDKLIPFVIDNKDKFKDNFWNDFIADLNKKYADEIVNYDGVNLRLGGLLYGVGLLKNYDKDKPVDKKKAGVGLKRQYEIYGQSLRPFPVEVIKGS
ncbi:MAG: PQQ-binding-like beta-propeller repeat protein [Candidatus Omnitrophica bacterium]|nr:PQQ-binding-like beta-propeller repeat protein [Candidatus Omnitrophota bacterium]